MTLLEGGRTSLAPASTRACRAWDSRPVGDRTPQRIGQPSRSIARTRSGPFSQLRHLSCNITLGDTDDPAALRAASVEPSPTARRHKAGVT